MQFQSFEGSPGWSASNTTHLPRMGRMMLEDAVKKRQRGSTSDSAERVLEHFESEFLNKEAVETHIDKQNIQTTNDLKKLEEAVVQSEDLQFGNNSALYTTQIADFIEREFRPRLVAADVIRTTEVGQGYDSLKVPKQPDLQVASTIADDGTLTDDSADYGSLTINTDFIGLRSKVTMELLKNATVDLLEDQLRQITFALQRKVDSDIITEIQKASTKNDGTYGSNNNFLYLGNGNNVTYDDMVDAYYAAVANNANPDMFLCSPDFAANLAEDSDMKEAVAFGTTRQGEEADTVPRIQSFMGKPLMVSSQVGSNRGYWLDTDRLGWLVNKSGIETMDQQLDNQAAFEVKAARGFGVGITRPQSVYSVIEQTAEP